MKKTYFLLAALLVTVFSCTPEATNTGITDTWKRDGYDVYLTVNADGTHSGQYTIPMDPSHTQYDVHGTYTINGDVFEFVDLSGTSSCAFGDTGTYHFTVNETTLHLALISDQCSGRSVYMPGNWTRQ